MARANENAKMCIRDSAASGPGGSAERSAGRTPGPALRAPREVPSQPLALMRKILISVWGPIQATGTVSYTHLDNAYTAAEVALVTAEIDGPVAQVNVVDSQQVKRGDVLVVIDDTDTRLALRQAEADLARARAQVSAATADVERSGIDLKRREALVESGSVSGDELTHVKNGASNARAALDAARAAVALAQARVDKANVDLGRTVIRLSLIHI